MKVLSVQDEFLHWHLLNAGLFPGLVQVKLASGGEADGEDEFGGELQELGIRWRTLVAPGAATAESLKDVDWLPENKSQRVPPRSGVLPGTADVRSGLLHF